MKTFKQIQDILLFQKESEYIVKKQIIFCYNFILNSRHAIIFKKLEKHMYIAVLLRHLKMLRLNNFISRIKIQDNSTTIQKILDEETHSAYRSYLLLSSNVETVYFIFLEYKILKQ